MLDKDLNEDLGVKRYPNLPLNHETVRLTPESRHQVRDIVLGRRQYEGIQPGDIELKPARTREMRRKSPARSLSKR